MPSILVTRKLPSSVLAKLEPVGTVELYAEGGVMPHDELIARAADKDALVCMLTDQIDRAVLDAATRLKVVGERRGRLQQHRRPVRAIEAASSSPTPRTC